MPRPSAAPRWRALIAEYTRSGETIAAFCRLRGLQPPTFYMWRRRLSVDDATARAPAPFLPIQIAPARASASALELESSGSGVEVVLSGGRRLRLARGFDPAVLTAALAVLEEGAPC